MRAYGVVFGVVALLGVVPLLLGDNPYVLGMGISFLMMAGLASAWNIPGGFAGQYSFGHAVYFGAGAYTTLILVQGFGVHVVVALFAGTVVAMLLALLTGAIVFRLRGHYFALASIAVAEIVRLSVLNAEITGGAQGLLLDTVSLWGLDLESKIPFFYGMLLVLAGVLLLTVSLERSRMGYLLQAVREDQDAASSLGINVFWLKVRALLLSAFVTALCGSLYGLYIRYIDTGGVLELRLSIEIILMAIIGGVGTVWGPFVGALVLVPLAEVLRSNLIGSWLVDSGMVAPD